MREMNIKEEELLHATRVHSNLISMRNAYTENDVEYYKLTKEIKKAESIINDLTRNLRS